MRIPFIILPKYRKYIKIEKKYISKNLIIPIGCDCHPSYTLGKLNIRIHSLPFDWLNTDPILGVQYVVDNLKTDFTNFLSNLTLNEKGNIVSQNYPYAEFLHEKDLIANELTRIKFKRRITRFLDFYKTNDCFFLYNVTSESLINSEKATFFIKSVEDFSKLIKANDKVFIYIRYDESLQENEIYCNQVFDAIQKIDKVATAKYIRSLKKYGGWGNEKEYFNLYKKLGIKLKLAFPRIYFK